MAEFFVDDFAPRIGEGCQVSAGVCPVYDALKRNSSLAAAMVGKHALAGRLTQEQVGGKG